MTTSVSATSSTSTATATTAAASATALAGTQDEFLKLFMAQLQNQDPLDPQNGADMVAQLAQFSSVEQQTETNQQLADLTSAQQATSSASLATLVGRDCSASAGSFSLSGSGNPPPLQVTSDNGTIGASLTITDSNGNQVRQIPIPDGTTATTMTWDGNTDAGTKAPSGDYTMTINSGKTTATVAAQWQGNVDGIELTSAGARLRMGDVLVTPSSVQTIGETTTPTTSTSTGTGTSTTTP